MLPWQKSTIEVQNQCESILFIFYLSCCCKKMVLSKYSIITCSHFFRIVVSVIVEREVYQTSFKLLGGRIIYADFGLLNLHLFKQIDIDLVLRIVSYFTNRFTSNTLPYTRWILLHYAMSFSYIHYSDHNFINHSGKTGGGIRVNWS